MSRFLQFLHFLPIYYFCALFIKSTASVSNIELNGEAGFRMASLQWRYPKSTSFKIRYCELHTFGMHRCRYKVVDGDLSVGGGRSGRHHDMRGSATPESNDLYQVEIGGLRMATNYSFSVLPQDPASQREAEEKPSHISLQTKGFNAKATKCLADSSEVMVETGPYFGGRISVEDALSPACYIKGNSHSSQTKYSLRIRHKECGSVVNGSKVTTNILVQENMPILTHSTRRFVVLCSFSPESFLVSAGVNLPREPKSGTSKSIDFHHRFKKKMPGSNRIGRAGLLGDAEEEEEEAESVEIIVKKPLPPPPLPSFVPLGGQGGHPLEFENEVDSGGGSPSNLLISQAHSLPEGASGRSLEGNMGHLETILVFGMICIAILASMGSIIWFIKSNRRSGSDTESNYSDSDSYDGSSISSSSSGHPPLTSGGLVAEDEVGVMSIEPEVELDFEFSEEPNHSHSSQDK